MKKLKIAVIALLLISMAVSFSTVTVKAATISSGSTYSSLDGTSGRLVINSVDSFVSGTSWNVTVSFTVNMVNSWLYTGGREYYRFFIAEINGVTGPSTQIKTNTECWYSGTSYSFSYNLIFPVDPNNNVVSARFRVMDANSNTGDTATFDTGYGTVTLQPVQKATDLNLNVSSKTLYAGDTFTVIPTVSPSDTYNKAVNYYSSDASVASVPSGGVITAKKAGNAVITVTTADGSNISRTVNVTVNQYVTGITVNNTSPALYTGSTFQIVPTVTPSDATDKSLSYSSDNTAVATVNASGLITAVKAGTARVTVIALDRSTVKCTVTITVLQKATSVAIDKSLTSLYTGETYHLRCSVLPSDTTDKSITYMSSDTNVVTIDPTGLITAKKAGTAIITVKTADGSNVSDSVTFTVYQHVTDIAINDMPQALYTGETFQLTPSVMPADATNKTLSYTSDNTEIAKINESGLITAIKAGSATITIAAADGSSVEKTVTVTVLQRAASFAIDNTIEVLYNGQTYRLSCSVLPEDTTDKSVTYASSNPSVASIDESGLIITSAKGKTTITVTTNDGSSISKSFEIEVKQYVESVANDKNELTLYTGEKETLNVTVLPADANNKELDFSSFDPSVAAVNTSGKITALKAGTTIITATAADGSGCFDTVNVTVKQYALEITVSEDQVELPINNTYQIIANTLPDDTTDKSLTYSSTDESILIVDENGLVTAFDAYLYQMLENKQRFISQIMTSKSPVRSAEDIDETALSYAEVKALATGNPLIKEKMDLDIQVSKLKLFKANHLSQRYALEDRLLKYYPQQIRLMEQRIAAYEKDFVLYQQNNTTESAKTDKEENKFAGMTVNGIHYTQRAKAGAAILEACKQMNSPEAQEFGSYMGFSMMLGFDSFDKLYQITLKGALNHTVSLGTDVHGNIARLNNLLAEIPKKLEYCKEQLTTLNQQMETAKEQINIPFEKEEELQTKSARLNELNILLSMDKDENVVLDGEPEEEIDAPQRCAAGFER